MGLQISRCIHSEMSMEDALRAITASSGRSVSGAGVAGREPDRGRTFDARSRLHDDFDTTEVRGVSSGRVYQRGERDPFGTGVWRAQTQLCESALLGARLFRFDSGARRSDDPGVYPASGARRAAARPDAVIALNGYLEVAQVNQGRVSDPA